MPAVENPPLPPKDLVSLNCDSLIVGRTLRLPIYDQEGLLLLAEGMMITPDFRETLLERQLTAIRVHPEEVPNISCSDFQEQMPSFGGDGDLTKRLDEIIDAGFLTVVNSEPALVEQVARHGAANYNLEEHRERVERNRESSAMVDGLLRNALHGKSIDFSQVLRLTGAYMANMVDDMDSSIASMVDAVGRDGIADHCVKMSLLGMALGVEMLLDAPNVRNLGLAGLVHDWGMVRVPAEIRGAQRFLTAEERFHLTKHPMHTLGLLEKLVRVPGVVPVVAYQVHECPNGNGYPRGRTRDRIHIMARILSVADRYGALTAPRSFRPPLTPYAAMECLLRQAAAGEVDAEAVRALLTVQSLFPIGSYVVLSNGSTARVLRRNGNKFVHPIVRIVKDGQGREVPEDAPCAIIDLGATGLEVVQALPAPGSNAIGLSPQILHRDAAAGERVWTDGEGSAATASEAEEGSPPSPEEPEGCVLGPSIPSLEYYSESQKRRALDALDVLDTSAHLTNRVYQRQRIEKRIALRTVASVCLPDPRHPIVSVESGRLLRVFTRDISTRGVSFVCPDELSQKQILVGMHVTGQDTRWFLSDVVRAREVSDTGFWEHAAVFRQAVAL